jgi:hypothetical protein
MKPKIMTVAVLIMAMGVIACGKASAQDKKPKEDKGNKPAKLVLKKGEKIAFIGDSITAGGQGRTAT